MSKTAVSGSAPTPAGLYAFVFCLNRSRFSVIVLIAGLALLLSDQGQDVLTAYSEEKNKILRVAIAEAIWAFSIWGWSRLLLDVHYNEQPSCTSCYNWSRKWLARLLGSLAFVVVVFSAYQTDQFFLVWWGLGGFAVFLVLVTWRRAAGRKLASLLGKSSGEFPRMLARALEIEDIGPESKPPHENFWEMLGLHGPNSLLTLKSWKLRTPVALAMILGFVFLYAVGHFEPVWLGNRAGPLILFFLWGSTLLPLGSWMSYIADKHGYPLIALLVVAALISSYTNDNHEIRHAQNGVDVKSRPSVTQALDVWGEANRTEGDEAIPFVVVATAGGGIRAAYWTGTVLGDIHDRADNFPQRTFALSGVSGGSVGATVYRALLDVPPEQLRKPCDNKMKVCAQLILGNDFLGPLTAAMLFPDLAQRFWPMPIFPDRAAALEESLEDSFYNISGSKALTGSLGALGVRAGVPSLFLNATWVDNGRRIVASNVQYSKDNPDEAASFVLSNDELDELGYDLRLSTAAHNSARFPFVSPPGMWKHNGKIAGRLQDGGLFENYGAETALEILDLACHRFACPEADKETKKIKQNIIPVVILITSDPSLPDDLFDSPKLDPIQFGYEVRSTFRTYERVRGGRGAEAIYKLKEWAKKNGGNSFEFRMCQNNSKAVQPPLGWTLSPAAQDTIKSYLFGDSKNPSKQPSCYHKNAKAEDDFIGLLSHYKSARETQAVVTNQVSTHMDGLH